MRRILGLERLDLRPQRRAALLVALVDLGSSCSIVSGRGRRSAIRRAIAIRMVRPTAILAGEPDTA